MSHLPSESFDSYVVPTQAQRPRRDLCTTKKCYIGGIVAAVVVLIVLGVGLGVGLSLRAKNNRSLNDSRDGSSSNSSRSIWRPIGGTTFQIELINPLMVWAYNAAVYDIDLFTNEVTTISKLQTLGRRVICYFSAGSYEDFRPDSSQFLPSDYGKGLTGWAGEYWLNTSSPTVRKIMQARLDIAVQKGCDGVDPDNVDGYTNDNNIGLTETGALEYVRWLASEAHSRNLAIGLKNAAGLVNGSLDVMEWQVNEQCVQYDECQDWQPFITAGKPVFHIEYTTSTNVMDASKKNRVCSDTASKGFTTVIKNMNLDDWIETC